MVTKADGGWRPCSDFRRLNNATTADRYPAPHIKDVSAHLAGAAIFEGGPGARLPSGAVGPQDVPKTAVITPFGLKGAAQTFQRLMDPVLRDMPFLFVYLDVILMASASADDRLTRLQQLFGRLSEHGLIVNLAECELGRSSITLPPCHPAGGRSPPCQGGRCRQLPTPAHCEVSAGVPGHGVVLQPFPPPCGPTHETLVRRLAGQEAGGHVGLVPRN